MKDKHSVKMVAPIVITVIIIAYYLGFFMVCMTMSMPMVAKLMFGLVPIFLAGVCIFVLTERIREIRSGEEDDLSQY